MNKKFIKPDRTTASYGCTQRDRQLKTQRRKVSSNNTIIHWEKSVQTVKPIMWCK